MMEERQQVRHPRQGFVVALYHGVRGRLDEQQLLVEIYETYNVWADEDSKRYHYRPIDLSSRGEKDMPVKTIAGISAPIEGSHQPPSFVLNQFEGYHWVRLR